MNNRTTILKYHRTMVRDQIRVERYREAILRTVKPGDVVLDIGTGTGLQAFFACQAGARRVYAVEGGEILAIARHLCTANGFDDRVVFVEGMSDQVSLPEPVDVVITETLGNIGLDEGILGWVSDASKRFLKAGGAIIPASVAVHVVPVESHDTYEALDFSSSGVFGIDYSSVRQYMINNPWRTGLDPDAFLAEPLPVFEVDLAGIGSLSRRGQVTFRARRNGVVHGIGGWFSTVLADAIHLSNAPPNEAPSWNHVLFPLKVPAHVREGDVFSVSISTVDGREWSWKLNLDSAHTVPQPVAGGEHASLFGFPLSHGALKRGAASYAPVLSKAGQVELSALSLVDGRRSIEDIVAELMSQHPDFFVSEMVAGAFVRRVVARASQ